MASLNKQALIRYRIINEMIRSQTFPRMNDILNKCEERLEKRFSMETIQKDISAMKNSILLGYFAPIKYNRAEFGYEYKDKEYSIDKISLSNAEYDVLEDVVDILNQFKGTQLSENYNNALDKISTSILSAKENYKNPIISMESTSISSSLKDIDRYVKLIREHIPISVISTANRKSISDILHPYMLKEHRNRWYLLAYSENHKDIRPFKIAFIKKIEFLKSHKFMFKEFNADLYFNDLIGVGLYQPNKKQKVRIKFAEAAYDNVFSTPLHSSQRIIKEYKNGKFIIEIEVSLTVDLFYEILSYGHYATVLKPRWMVRVFKHFVSTMVKNYGMKIADT